MTQLKKVLPSASAHWVGDGFPVQTLISVDRDAPSSSPFLMLDHAGPHVFEPSTRQRGVGTHPHRGFETVTIVYDGEVAHRDSVGNAGVIGPGDVQWMTAASGILHEEFHSPEYARRGGNFEMAQLWVNLPASEKLSPPRYQAIAKAEIPVLSLPADAGTLRVIAGHCGEAKGPAHTASPINVFDVLLTAGKTVALPTTAGWSTLLVVLRGRVKAAGSTLQKGQTAHFEVQGEPLQVIADTDSQLLYLTGEPLNEPIAHYGPFVMNTRAELVAAVEDFNSGRFGRMSASA